MLALQIVIGVLAGIAVYLFVAGLSCSLWSARIGDRELLLLCAGFWPVAMFVLLGCTVVSMGARVPARIASRRARRSLPRATAVRLCDLDGEQRK